MRRLISILTLIFIIPSFGSCGGGGAGFVTISLEEAGIPAELSTQYEALKIVQFRATVEASDINPPIVATADPSAKEITIEEVPYGESRTILVEALNPFGDVVRRRRMEGLEIRKGVVSEVRGRMHTVPIALNLRSGSVIPISRFRIQGFGEPGSPIRIGSEAASTGPISFDVSPGTLPVVSASLSTGLFEFSTPPLGTGKQKITFLDESTGESSSMAVYIVEGELPGRQLATTSDLGPTIGIDSILGGARARNFPQVLRALTQRPSKKSEEVSP